MPLFEIGYRRFEGARTSHALRWWPIARTGLSIALRAKLLRRLIYVSFLPFLYFGWVFFVIGRITDPNADPSSPFYELARELLGRQLVIQLHEDPAAVRTAVWTVVFGYFGSFFQLLIAGLVGAIAGPPLIANDLGSRAFLIYFARPVSRFDYILGKAATLVALLATVTLLPSLFLYALSILFSPSLGTIVQTLPVLGSIVLASVGTIVPAALVLLTLSSLTVRPRFAALSWFVVCLFGLLTHTILQETRALRDSGWTFLVSLPNLTRTYQLGLYDVEGRAQHLALNGDLADLLEGLRPTDSPTHATIGLGVLSLVCLFALWRRVDAPTRI